MLKTTCFGVAGTNAVLRLAALAGTKFLNEVREVKLQTLACMPST